MRKPTGTDRPVRLGPRSVAALVLISGIGAVFFGWPLLADAQSGLAAHAGDAPWLFGALLPLLVAVVVATIADTGMDAKAVAMLGVLAAVGAALRPLGAGTAGLEPMFFLMVLSGRVLGPGFGFVLGAVTMFASALLTGGVGPWMPFQMLSMGWFTMGAGLLPGSDRIRGRAELLMLAAYGAFAAFAYGTVMNLHGWTLITGMSSGISFHPGDALHENLVRFVAYCAATSLGWDLGRAVLTVVLTLTLGATLLKALRRATRRAAFDAPVAFEGKSGPGTNSMRTNEPCVRQSTEQQPESEVRIAVSRFLHRFAHRRCGNGGGEGGVVAPEPAGTDVRDPAQRSFPRTASPGLRSAE